MSPRTRFVLAVALPSLAVAACGGNPEPSSAPPPGWESLPDTTVCVVDRSSDTGLRALEARRGADGGLLVRADAGVRPLESVHPVSLIAGYAGEEGWFSSGEPIALGGSRFVRVEGERSVPIDLLARAGEYRGILLFADPGDDPPPDALYVPARPGCIFQAYVREELVRGGG